jgi:hypothetical protein
LVGPVIVMVGAVVSAPLVLVDIVHVNDCDVVNAPSNARAVTANDPAVVPVPEMKPVLPCTERPGGRPEALYVSGWDAGSEPTSCSVTCCPTVDD